MFPLIPKNCCCVHVAGATETSDADAEDEAKVQDKRSRLSSRSGSADVSSQGGYNAEQKETSRTAVTAAKPERKVVIKVFDKSSKAMKVDDGKARHERYVLYLVWLSITRKLCYRKHVRVMRPTYECFSCLFTCRVGLNGVFLTHPTCSLLKIASCSPGSRWMAFGLRRAKVLG